MSTEQPPSTPNETDEAVEALEEQGVEIDPSNLTARHGLSNEDLEFCHHIHFSDLSQGRAYTAAYGHPQERGLKSNPSACARDKLRNPRIQRYLKWINADPLTIARNIRREVMVLGTPAERMKAAREEIAEQEKVEKTDPIDRYFQIVAECGYEQVVPVPVGTQEAVVSLKDLLGKGFMRASPKAVVELLHRAGAPWNETDPSWKLSPLQIEILERRERTVIVHGGSGVGKSVLGACLALATLSVPGTRTAIIGATYDLASSEFQYVYEGFLKLFGKGAAARCVYRNTRTQHDMEIRTHWGSSVVAFSLDRDQGQQMFGKEFDRVVLCEASRIDADVYLRSVFRATSRRMKKSYVCADSCEYRVEGDVTCSQEGHSYLRETGQTSMFTTPVGFDGTPAKVYEDTQARTEGHFERAHFGQVPYAESVYVREADCLENPSYSDEAYRAAEATLPRDIFDEQFRGKMVRRSGLIYEEFRSDKCAIERPPWEVIRQMRLGVGIDTGKRFAAVLAGIDQERRKWLLGEVYTLSATTEHNALDVMRMVNRVVGPAWGAEQAVWDVDEPTDVRNAFSMLCGAVDLWRIDPASQNEYDLMSHLGDECGLMYDDLELLGTISQCRTWFEKGEMMVGRTPEGEILTPWLVWEFARYRWKRMAEGRGDVNAQMKPEAANDHACDAMRYIVVPLDQMGPIEIPDATVLSPEEAYLKAHHAPIADWQKAAKVAMRGTRAGQELPAGVAGGYYRVH